MCIRDSSSSTGEISRHTDVHRLVTTSDYDSYVRGEPPRLPLRDLLDASGPENRKQLIGNFLFPYLEPILGALSAKVVGMLLEFTLGELYNFIFDAPSLADIVVTALVALDGYTSSPSLIPTVTSTSHLPLLPCTGCVGDDAGSDDWLLSPLSTPALTAPCTKQAYPSWLADGVVNGRSSVRFLSLIHI